MAQYYKMSSLIPSYLYTITYLSAQFTFNMAGTTASNQQLAQAVSPSSSLIVLISTGVFSLTGRLKKEIGS